MYPLGQVPVVMAMVEPDGTPLVTGSAVHEHVVGQTQPYNRPVSVANASHEADHAPLPIAPPHEPLGGVPLNATMLLP